MYAATARNAAGETPWDLAQANEALQCTDGYWRLAARVFVYEVAERVSDTDGVDGEF